MADLAKIVDDLSSLTVLEAAELSKLLEEKWGVSAALIILRSAFGRPQDPAAHPGRTEEERGHDGTNVHRS